MGDWGAFCADSGCTFGPGCLCLMWGPVDAPVGVLWLCVSVCATAVPAWAGGTCAHVCVTTCVHVQGHMLRDPVSCRLSVEWGPRQLSSSGCQEAGLAFRHPRGLQRAHGVDPDFAPLHEMLKLGVWSV